MKSTTKQRRAFTLVELLVVIAIIGIMVGMVLPAVQSVRESSRRLSCQSNMTELVLALHAYESHSGYFPAGVVEAVGPIRNIPSGYHHNWLSSLLPYLDQPNLYRSINFRESVYAPSNLAARKATLGKFVCPSATLPFNITNYAGSYHSREAPIDSTNDGLFIRNRTLRIDDVPDGLSCTIGIGEKILDATDFGWASGTRSSLRNFGSPLNRGSLSAKAHHRVIIETDEIDAFMANKQTKSGADAAELEVYGSKGYLESLIGSPSGVLEVGTFSSMHPTGMHFGYADGSVRFQAVFTSIDVLRQCANRMDSLPLTISE
jgi:prepilin-type N-terminal cleavage/methylation domain-containing protein